MGYNNMSLLGSIPAGSPGDISRTPAAGSIQARIAAPDAGTLLWGYPVKVVVESGIGYVSPLVAGDVVTDVYGWIVRDPFGLTPPNSNTSNFDIGTQSNLQPLSVLVRDYLLVDVNTTIGSAPVLDGAVYINLTGVNGRVGSVATAPTADYVLLPNHVFANNGTNPYGTAPYGAGEIRKIS